MVFNFFKCKKMQNIALGVIKMKRKGVLGAAMILVLTVLALAADRAVLVHNTRQDIEAVKGKLKLKLVRVWGGEDEADENKFFETPTCVAIDKNGLVYICDMHRHCIKVFKSSGEYVRTIGRRGKGPGDVFAPEHIALSPAGGLVVSELGGWRIQRLNAKGKSKAIIKCKWPPYWLGVTSKDELAIYNSKKMFQLKKLIFICDNKGKTIREIGTYHDKWKEFLGADKLQCTMDENDNIYAANSYTPVIRKYSADGKLLLAITYDTLIKIPPVKITLNSRGDEIEKVDENEYNFKVTKRGRNTQAKGKRRPGVCYGIGTDPQKRIYIVTRRRLFTEKERKAAAIGWSAVSVLRERMDFDVLDKIKDIYNLFVFNQEGKIIAEAEVPNFCDGIHIIRNRLFIVDGTYYQRILEFEISFEE
jgi:hypothetical protein